jgi:hypothetical protein
VSRMSEIGADRAALAVQLIKGSSAPSSDPGLTHGVAAAQGGFEDIL